MIVVREQDVRLPVPDEPVCRCFEFDRSFAAKWDGEVDLHPPADVDKRVRNVVLLDELPDLKFLPEPEVR